MIDTQTRVYEHYGSKMVEATRGILASIGQGHELDEILGICYEADLECIATGNNPNGNAVLLSILQLLEQGAQGKTTKQLIESLEPRKLNRSERRLQERRQRRSK